MLTVGRGRIVYLLVVTTCLFEKVALCQAWLLVLIAPILPVDR